MKLLLVSPINRTYVIMPMLGLGYLAAIGRKNGLNVDILDCKKEKINYKNFSSFIKNGYYDIIGFQVFSYDVNSVKKHIDIIRKHNRKTILIAGGAHPSGDPVGFMKYIQELDFCFRGECEFGFQKLINLLKEIGQENIRNAYDILKDISNLIFRGDDGEVVVNEPRYVDDLDSLDFPAWDLMDPRGYPEAPHGAFAKQFPTAPIIITRGCPYTCTFCAGKSLTGPKVRRRSIDNVWSEIEYLVDNFGVKELLIEDENFTFYRDLLKEFCLKLINSKKKISWSFPAGVRLETLNADNIALMEEAGCYSMAVGIEFGSQRIHDITKKNLKIELIEEKIRLLSKTRIKKTGFFLMGIPGETQADMLSTIDLALRLDIDRAQFNNFMPLPGSELWDNLISHDKLMQINWDSFFVHDVAFVSDNISKKQQKRLQRLAYMKFYLRLKIICNILKEVRSFRHFRMLVHRFIDALL